MTDPLFWLVLSFLFVTVSLTLVLAVAIPALREIARAARSAEKLFDTLAREFPPTLESIRLTGMEISDLTEDVSQGVQSAGQVVKQVDESLTSVRQQARKVQQGTRSLAVGLRAAWRAFSKAQKPPTARRTPDRLPPARPELNLKERPARADLEERSYRVETSEPLPLEEAYPKPQYDLVAAEEFVHSSDRDRAYTPAPAINHPLPERSVLASGDESGQAR